MVVVVVVETMKYFWCCRERCYVDDGTDFVSLVEGPLGDSFIGESRRNAGLEKAKWGLAVFIGVCDPKL